MTKAKVFIVEDDIITAAALRNELRDLGYSICSFAISGEKAIKTAQQERPDVVLMDIKLCGEMDGFETAREIRSRFGIPIIYMTGYPMSVFEGKEEINEPSEYLSKPVNINDVRDAIESVLKK